MIMELERRDIESLLARNNVGRMAYARGNTIDIEPIHYVYANGWLYGRTSPGRRLDVTARDWWPVAFEVDEVNGAGGWRSVVVHGGFYTLDPDGSSWQRAEARRALELLRDVLPEHVDGDGVLFRIAVQEVTGKASQ